MELQFRFELIFVQSPTELLIIIIIIKSDWIRKCVLKMRKKKYQDPKMEFWIIWGFFGRPIAVFARSRGRCRDLIGTRGFRSSVITWPIDVIANYVVNSINSINSIQLINWLIGLWIDYRLIWFIIYSNKIDLLVF